MVPRNSRNLGTGRPIIQCTACGEYSHWRRECPYDNFCTTCNNHDQATHMCRAPKQTPQWSPATCVYCGSMEHSSSQCRNRPWDNRGQLPVMLETSRNQKFQSTNSKILGKAGFQPSNAQGRTSQLHSHRSYSEISRSTGSYKQTIVIIISFLGETRTTAVTREEIQLQVLVNTLLDSNSKIIMLIILVQILGIMGTSQKDQHSPMLGLMRDTTSSTLHPYTHLHLH